MFMKSKGQSFPFIFSGSCVLHKKDFLLAFSLDVLKLIPARPSSPLGHPLTGHCLRRVGLAKRGPFTQPPAAPGRRRNFQGVNPPESGQTNKHRGAVRLLEHFQSTVGVSVVAVKHLCILCQTAP